MRAEGRCAGVLMCGGASRRMGCDKVFLTIEGESLWRRQIRKLEAVCDEVWLASGTHAPESFEEYAPRCIPDERLGVGPLAGLSAVLGRVSADWLLVLAVDLPFLSVDFLESLRKAAREGVGQVPISEQGFVEGLSAIYPCAIRALVEEQLRGKDFSLKALMGWALERGWITASAYPVAQGAQFANWNEPADRQASRSIQILI